MATNKFLPFAAGDDANVMSDDDYANALATNGAYQKGVTTGQASSKQANKTWRQSSLMAAAIAQVIVDFGQDAHDALTPEQLAALIRSALLTQTTADARYVRGVWNATTDQRILSIARNKTDSGIYVQLDDNTNQRLQLFGDYATNTALSAEITNRQSADNLLVAKNVSQGPSVISIGIVSASGQPFCVDSNGRLRYLVKSPGSNATDVPIQSVGINNQRIYVSYDNDTKAAWLVRSPAEGSADMRVGSVGIAGGRPYFGYGGSNDATSALWLATEDFARGSFSFQAAGYQRFPSGLIVQWDTVSAPASSDPANNYATFNFPTSFPRGCFGVVGVDFGGDCNPIGANPINNGQAQIRSFKRLTNAASNVTIVHYWAWGY